MYLIGLIVFIVVFTIGVGVGILITTDQTDNDINSNFMNPRDHKPESTEVKEVIDYCKEVLSYYNKSTSKLINSDNSEFDSLSYWKGYMAAMSSILERFDPSNRPKIMTWEEYINREQEK